MYCGALVILICALVFDCNALNCTNGMGKSQEKFDSTLKSCMKKMGITASFSNSDAGNRGRPDEQYHEEMSAEDDWRRDNNMKHSDGSPMGEEVASFIQAYPFFNIHPASSPRGNRRRRRRGKVQPRDAQRNSGHRSQYNHDAAGAHRGARRGGDPNVKGIVEEEKDCLSNCFLQNLDMTGFNGMANRDRMINIITKDVQKKELKDFLQKSIEECFQLPYDKNNDDKCKFADHIMMCIGGKSKVQCEDFVKRERAEKLE